MIGTDQPMMVMQLARAFADWWLRSLELQAGRESCSWVSLLNEWTEFDNMENTLTAIEKLRKKYVRVLTSSKPKDDDDGDDGDP